MRASVWLMTAGRRMSESELYGQIMRALSRGEVRLFRQQAGVFWNGKIIEKTVTRLVLANPRAVRVGVPGISDLGGLVSHLITPADVGRRVAIYVGIEGKSLRGRNTPEQENFQLMVRQMGGRAGVARTVDDAARILYPV